MAGPGLQQGKHKMSWESAVLLGSKEARLKRWDVSEVHRREPKGAPNGQSRDNLSNKINSNSPG